MGLDAPRICCDLRAPSKVYTLTHTMGQKSPPEKSNKHLFGKGFGPLKGEKETQKSFRRRVRRLRELSERLELVFLVDESSSVGQANFLSELKFVRKLLSDFPVVPTATRVAIVTFSSKNNVVPRVDYISSRRAHQHKCALLSREIPAITYRGGGTYTKGAFQQAAVRHPAPAHPGPRPLPPRFFPATIVYPALTQVSTLGKLQPPQVKRPHAQN
ncbi:Sushi, von Willebrand factor type A, EGF and pentraxin domain-containing protein 1 [Pteropus alecto]|uniref:Sushi, von Willebrand factor type A, EGF and pentraxin domain-containing protein 1 n=1 Tax=Pteropus alecto TaxID=9402 RepID=L5L3P7_PTEAL|nr:Sushi, von Willebrand factor type A, EGF and pentraxin domain-containing protein 1 [Pteropus alecto]